jgi:hypothetical protein
MTASFAQDDGPVRPLPHSECTRAVLQAQRKPLKKTAPSNSDQPAARTAFSNSPHRSD